MAMYYGDSNGKAQQIVVTGMQGPAGPQGPQGEPGPQGSAGQGVPAGGGVGQVLTKDSLTDYDTKWTALTSYPEITGTQTNPFKFKKTFTGVYCLTHNPSLVDPLPNPVIPPGINSQTIEYDAYISEGIPSSYNGVSSGVSCEIKGDAIIFKRIRVKNSTGQIVADIFSINNGSQTTASTNLPNIDTPVIWM